MLVLPKITRGSPNRVTHTDPSVNELSPTSPLLSNSVPDLNTTLSRRIYNNTSIQLNTLSSSTKTSQQPDRSHLFTFDKILRLINDKLSQNHIERQLVAILKLLENRENGFAMIETAEVVEVVNFSVTKFIEFSSLDNKQEKIASQTQQILLKFIQLSSRPLIFTKTSDEKFRIDALADIINSTCKIMRLPLLSGYNLKLKAAEAVHVILTRDLDSAVMLKAMKKSALISELILELDSILKDKELMSDFALEVVYIVRDISLQKDMVARFAESGGFEKIVTLISRSTSGEKISFYSVELLWNAVERNHMVKEILGTFYCTKILYELILSLTNEGYRKKDKELRNDVLTLLCFVAEVKNVHRNFIDTGLLNLLLQLCFVESNPETAKKDKCSTENSFELKKLIFQLLFLLSFSKPCVDYMVECNIIPVLDSYIFPLQLSANMMLQHQGLTDYEVDEIQLQVYTVLYSLAYSKPYLLIQNQVVTHLLSTLQSADDIKVREHIFQILINLASSDEGLQELSTEEFFQICLELIRFGNSLEEKQLIFSIFSLLCDGRDYNKKMFRECGGIAVLIQLIPDFISHRYSFYLLDALWNCVIEDTESEKLFIDNNGFELLFDIFEQVEDYVKYLLLGFLADIGIHFKEIFTEELYVWKSSLSKKSMPQLLIEQWNQISVAPNQWLKSAEVSNMEQNADFKLKIFHLFRVVDFMAFEEFTFSDLSVLSEIRLYHKMQIDDTWHSIDKLLEQRGIRPTTPDQELLDKKLTKRTNRKEELLSIQQQYSNKEMELQKLTNEEFTNALRDSFKKPVTKKLMSITEAKKKKNAMLNTTTMLSQEKNLL